MDDGSGGLTRRSLLMGGVAAAGGWMAPWVPERTPGSLILLWMNGGPSQAETFDPTPSVGGLRPIRTTTSGLCLSPRLPRLAEQTARFAVIREVASPESSHRRAWHYLHRGRRAPLNAMPPPRGAPMLHSLRSRMPEAFDLATEPPRLRREYGDTPFGRECLIARRLVERGAPFVEVELDGWDLHCDIAPQIDPLLATLDSAFAALLRDLSERDLLRTTLVVWMGDFGRTRQINRLGGRDHDPTSGCVVIAGCGVRGGRVIEGSPTPAVSILTAVAALRTHRGRAGARDPLAGRLTA